MNKRKITVFIIFISLFCLASFSYAQNIVNPLKVDTFDDLFANIIKTVGKLIAGVGTIMLIVAGILYVTSAGSPERIGKAKTALIYAVAGMAIGLAADGIVELIKSAIGTK